MLEIRNGSVADTHLLLRLLDEAIAWLVARGQIGQWGQTPFSESPQGHERVATLARSKGLRIAELEGEAVGALVLGERPAYAPAVALPELYISLVVTSRRHAGEQIGARLIERAALEAREAGLELLGVDCWAGAPKLVGWYERRGFHPTDTFDLDGWKGQALSMALDADAPTA